MQSKRAIVMLVLSVLAGLVAVLLAARWMGQQAAASQTRVVVAASDLELGQAINPNMLQEIAWPTATQPEGAFNDAKQLEGRVVRTTIFKGEPILAPKLAPEGTKAGLDSIIKDGRRAITVKVNEVVGVAGFLAPGSFVDLLVNIRDDKQTAVSKVVLERILVLAVAQQAERPEKNAPKVVNAVTLEVTPEEAEKIDLARNIGTLSLMLRNQVDTKDSATDGARRQDLFVADAREAATAPIVKVNAPAKRTAARPASRAAKRPEVRKTTTAKEGGDQVEVIRGVQKATSEF